MRRSLVAGLLGTVLAGLVTVLSLQALEGVTTSGRAYVRTFDRNTRPLDVALASGDGQAFAAIAADPTLSHPEVFRAGAPEAAYRAQRPLVSYAAWALSGGQSGLIPAALAVLFVLGEGLAVGASAALLERQGRRPELALLVLVLPPSLAALGWFGPEPLGMGLTIVGVLAWKRKTVRGTWSAVVLFSLAGLTRETFLLVPLMLAATGTLRRERPLRVVAPLALPFVVWLTWILVVHLRLAAWPWDAGDCRLAGKPLAGFLEATRFWPSGPSMAVVALAAMVVLAALCVWRRPSEELTWVVAGYAALGAFMGDCVWRRWEDFTRPLMPLYVFGLLALLGGALHNRALDSTTPRDDVRDRAE